MARKNRANAHEMHDSISLVSYAGCLGLSPVISARIYSKCASQPKIAKKSLKTHILGFKVVQGHSRSSMLVPRKACQQAVLVMIRSKSVSICNHSRDRLVQGWQVSAEGGLNHGLNRSSRNRFLPVSANVNFQLSYSECAYIHILKI